MSRNSYREKAVRQLAAFLSRNPDEDSQLSLDFKSGREFIATLASWAGKGKDEMVQLICREIGVATAAVLKEPLSQILENRKLQLTLELVPKEVSKKKSSKSRSRKKTSTKKP